MRRHLALVLVVLVCACGPSGDDGALYEEGEDLGEVAGAADGFGLSPRYSVTDYQARLEPRVVVETLPCRTFLEAGQVEGGERIVVLRTLSLAGVPTAVVALDRSFELRLVDAADLDGLSRGATADEVAEGFRYLLALERTRDGVLCHLHDDGRASGEGPQMRFALTLDMCQSSRAWEGDLYEWLAGLGTTLGRPATVGVAMTGLWAQRHPEGLEQLLAWQREGRLDVRWINHSFHHQLSQDAAGRYHFLTDPSVDLAAEVLDLEALLFEQGALFSPLFRFPGLTHDDRTLGELADLGLFPLDADGWVAKGERITDGGVVLLHGNGNEHVGVTMFFDWVEPREGFVETGEIELADPVETLPRASRDGTASGLETFAPCAP